ncbi:MAG TPA: hypothetical protein VK689_10845 [Armatimonadota bacterium]|nr:hypothetical protein [Armatimonadota bacterium]
MHKLTTVPPEPLVEREVTYTLGSDGKLIVVEHVPARVNVGTGEQFFSPQTVKRLQDILHRQPKPIRATERSVLDFLA